MTAPRRSDAASYPVRPRNQSELDLWSAAVPLRQEWLDHGLSTRPAERATTERHLIAVYARLGRPAPRFEWVESPPKALPLIEGLPTLDELYRWIRDPVPRGTPPLASDLAMLVADLRASLSARMHDPDPEMSPARRNKRGDPWPELAPEQALALGVPLRVVLHQHVRISLYRSLGNGFRGRVRGALGSPASVPVCWYGQQESSWIGYYDVLGRLGLAGYGAAEAEHLEDWADLARSCGWWWPGEDVCVVVDRPSALQVEPVPGGRLDELRLTSAGVTYRDGWYPGPG